MAQGDGCGLPLLLVTGTDLGTLLVRHRRQADGGGKAPSLNSTGARRSMSGTSSKRSGRNPWPVAGNSLDNLDELVAGAGLQLADGRVSPACAAMARSSASLSLPTATSRPPLVCGSHRMLRVRSSMAPACHHRSRSCGYRLVRSPHSGSNPPRPAAAAPPEVRRALTPEPSHISNRWPASPKPVTSVMACTPGKGGEALANLVEGAHGIRGQLLRP